jgi:hypothetical protein
MNDVFSRIAAALTLLLSGASRTDPAVLDHMKAIDEHLAGSDAHEAADSNDEKARLDAIEAGLGHIADSLPAPTPAPAPAAPATGPAATTTDPVKVLGATDGVIVANNTGATAFDPPIPGTPGPFDGAPVPTAPNSPAPVADPAAKPTGETATNVANPPSSSTIEAGKVDATSGVDQHGTITDVGVHGDAGTPQTVSDVPAA